VPLRSDWSEKTCPMARCLDVLGDPWAMLVMRDVLSGDRRFDELRSRLDVADSILSRRLAALCEAGLLEKVPYTGTVRPRYEYHPTAAGRDTAPILQALARWGDKHNTPPELEWTALRVYCRTCGTEATESVDWCVSCDAPLRPDSTAWTRPSQWEEARPLAV
jgi:DNA-binding HxlR family transcriptional regulator